MEICWRRNFVGKFLLNIFLVGNFGEKFLVENLEENAISDILEPHAFQKYSIHWVLEALRICLCLCLCLCIHVFVNLRFDHCHHQMIGFQKKYDLYGLEHFIVEKR